MNDKKTDKREDRNSEPHEEQAGITRGAGESTEDPRDRTIEELSRTVEDLRRQVEVTRDQLLRKAAEFENFRRRSENDFATIVRSANESLITSLIPIVNDFVRSLALGKDQKDPEAFFKGVEMIHMKLMRVLELQGVTSFESLGKPFDVGYHDALLQVPRTDVPPHTVIEEVERGYMLHDRVLRHAKVIVSAAPETPPAGLAGTPKEGDDQIN
jgi:molecular chaperone GrpE